MAPSGTESMGLPNKLRHPEGLCMSPGGPRPTWIRGFLQEARFGLSGLRKHHLYLSVEQEDRCAGLSLSMTENPGTEGSLLGEAMCQRPEQHADAGAPCASQAVFLERLTPREGAPRGRAVSPCLCDAGMVTSARGGGAHAIKSYKRTALQLSVLHLPRRDLPPRRAWF